MKEMGFNIDSLNVNKLIQAVTRKKKPANIYNALLEEFESKVFDTVGSQHETAKKTLDETNVIGETPYGGLWNDITKKFNNWKKNFQAKENIDELIKNYKKIEAIEKNEVGKLEEAFNKLIEAKEEKYIDGDLGLAIQHIANDYDFNRLFKKKENLADFKTTITNILNGIDTKAYRKNDLNGDKEIVKEDMLEDVKDVKEKLAKAFKDLRKEYKLGEKFDKLKQNALSEVDGAAFFEVKEDATEEEKKKMKDLKDDWKRKIDAGTIEGVEDNFNALYNSVNDLTKVKDEIGKIAEKTDALASSKDEILDLLVPEEGSLEKAQQAVNKVVLRARNAIPHNKLTVYSPDEKKNMAQALGILDKYSNYELNEQRLTYRQLVKFLIQDATLRGEPNTKLSEQLNDLGVNFQAEYQKKVKGEDKVDALLAEMAKGQNSLSSTNGFYARYKYLDDLETSSISALLQLDRGEGTEWNSLLSNSEVRKRAEKYIEVITEVNNEKSEMFNLAKDYQEILKKKAEISNGNLKYNDEKAKRDALDALVTDFKGSLNENVYNQIKETNKTLFGDLIPKNNGVELLIGKNIGDIRGNTDAIKKRADEMQKLVDNKPKGIVK